MSTQEVIDAAAKVLLINQQFLTQPGYHLTKLYNDDCASMRRKIREFVEALDIVIAAGEDDTTFREVGGALELRIDGNKRLPDEPGIWYSWRKYWYMANLQASIIIYRLKEPSIQEEGGDIILSINRDGYPTKEHTLRLGNMEKSLPVIHEGEFIKYDDVMNPPDKETKAMQAARFLNRNLTAALKQNPDFLKVDGAFVLIPMRIQLQMPFYIQEDLIPQINALLKRFGWVVTYAGPGMRGGHFCGGNMDEPVSSIWWVDLWIWKYDREIQQGVEKNVRGYAPAWCQGQLS